MPIAFPINDFDVLYERLPSRAKRAWTRGSSASAKNGDSKLAGAEADEPSGLMGSTDRTATGLSIAIERVTATALDLNVMMSAMVYQNKI
jgi:hypothetical protein